MITGVILTCLGIIWPDDEPIGLVIIAVGVMAFSLEVLGGC